ncbi:MAG: DNA starvation/stationary phase protection protein [Alphaproteobacteria bacterium]|nr:DNA starvation/stationary phase protection protein [Alphaproteobacteria bacterium]
MMRNKPVTEALKKLLADTYGLMVKTQNYHWNVEGPQFPGLHAMFMTQYSELFLAVDAIAERIRALGEKAPGSYGAFSKLSALRDGNSDFDADQMVKDLYDGNQTVLASIKKALVAAGKAGDDSTVDLLTQRIGVHDKAAWMLKSSLPKPTRVKLAV